MGSNYMIVQNDYAIVTNGFEINQVPESVNIDYSFPQQLLDKIKEIMVFDGVEAVVAKYLDDFKTLLIYVVIPEHDDRIEDMIFDKEDELQEYLDHILGKDRVFVDVRFRLSQGRPPLKVLTTNGTIVYVRS